MNEELERIFNVQVLDLVIEPRVSQESEHARHGPWLLEQTGIGWQDRSKSGTF